MRSAMRLAMTITMASLIVLGVVGCAGGSSGSSGSGNGLATSTTLIASSASVAVSASVTFTATVTVPTGFTAPTSNITFYDGSTLLGAGVCCSSSTPGGLTLTTSFSTAGTHTITAVYGGGSGFAGSTSNAVVITVAASSGTPSSGNPATLVYVEQGDFSTSPQVLAFTAGANGAVSPVSTLTFPTGFEINSIATDVVGQIYVAGYLNSGVAVINIYAAGASGLATPVRVIDPTNQYAPTAMTISGGLLYTVDGDSQLAVYSGTASGSATPQRLIYGVASLLGYSEGIAVDGVGNIWVSAAQVGNIPAELLMFSGTANGNVAPTRTIPTTTNNVYLGVAVDISSNVYASLDTEATPYSGAVVVYAGGATGSATPIKTIAGSSTGLVTGGGVEIDAAGNIYVADQITSTSYALLKFAPTATGNVAPTSETTSSSWNNAGSQIALK